MILIQDPIFNESVIINDCAYHVLIPESAVKVSASADRNSGRPGEMVCPGQ